MAKITVFGGSRSQQVDMCRGPLLRQIVIFVIPLMISGILQLMFNAADLVVIGRLASHKSLAAVGATGALTMMLVNLFIGLSVGTNVIVARHIGENNRKDVSRTVHTAVMTGLVGGAVLAAVGIVFSRILLRMMKTPDDILDMSTLYMRIYFGGMPVIMLYNFGSAVLQAMGDTSRPFYFLLIAGIINVLLNLLFVMAFHWDVAGVALATVISQAVAAALVVRCLQKLRGPCRFKWQGLHIQWKNLREMMWIGVPAGFQGSFFALSNMLIQSSINRFGSAAIAGMTAGATLEGFGDIFMNSIGQAVVSFVSQNYGGGQIGRIRKTVTIGLVMDCAFALTAAAVLLSCGRSFLAVFNADTEVIEFGMRRFIVTLPLLFVCAVMGVYNGALRGLGYSVFPTVISLFFVCVMRVVWIYTVFAEWPTIEVLFASYPVTWSLNALGVFLLWRAAMKRLGKKYA